MCAHSVANTAFASNFTQVAANGEKSPLLNGLADDGDEGDGIVSTSVVCLLLSQPVTGSTVTTNATDCARRQLNVVTLPPDHVASASRLPPKTLSTRAFST